MAAEALVSKDGLLNNGFNATADLTADSSNIKAPLFTYQWSNSGKGTFADTEGALTNANEHDIELNELNLSQDQLPTTDTVIAQVTDNDGVKISNTYTVNWHLPWEKTAFDSQVGIGKVFGTKLCGDVEPGDLLIWPEDHEDFEYSALLEWGGALLDLAADEDTMGLWEVAMKAAGLVEADKKFNDAGNQIGIRNDGTEWQVAQSDNTDVYGSGLNISGNPSIVASPDGWLYCKASLYVVSKWRDNRYIGDDYDSTGYVSPNNPMTLHTIDLVEEEPKYEQFKNPDGTPYTPPTE
jgi:hypothetical protein